MIEDTKLINDIDEIPVVIFDPNIDETSEQFEERIVSLIDARMKAGSVDR